MLFFDSSFILALFNKNDENHKSVEELLKNYPSIIKQKKVINNIVLMEVLNKLKKSYYKPIREDIINFLMSMDEIFYVEKKDYENAIVLMEQYKYDVNYSDCLIILTMYNHNIDTIVSFDDDFNHIQNIKRIYMWISINSLY